MKTYKLKSVARRGSMLGAAFAIVAASFIPAVASYADALNPLTERSLTLSSSSPGWSYKDGSGNSTYAEPNSGANGWKTGNTFSFRVSSDSASGGLKAMTFQYCTTSAGDCMGPGNNAVTGTGGSATRAANGTGTFDSAKTSDLEVVAPSATEVSTYASKFDATTGAPATGLATNGSTAYSANKNVPNPNGSEGSYIVLQKGKNDSTWTQSTGWTLTASVNQTKNGVAGTIGDNTSTGKNNYITLTNTSGMTISATDYVKVIFFGTNDNYITNPGSDEFFVKINTYSDTAATTVIDGGVTVANVMNRSIEIQTKVLETMDFSVGTVDPNTLTTAQLTAATGKTQHGICDAIAQGMSLSTETPNVLQLGNETGEFSLKTDTTYSTHSYWRLSSNSSAGATVYYSGVTLSNTVGDQIDAIGATSKAPTVGSEQFGLALDNGTDTSGTSKYTVSYATERADPNHLFQNGADNAVSGLDTGSLTTDGVVTNASWHNPQLYPLVPESNYANGTGVVNSRYSDATESTPATINTKFAFDPESNLIPTAIASESNQVVDCVTGKVRYIANIAATTPAGIYTTKINYIAAPQY